MAFTAGEARAERTGRNTPMKFRPTSAISREASLTSPKISRGSVESS